jgi:hypothetical protein
MAMTEIYYSSEPGNPLAVGKPVAGSAAQPGPHSVATTTATIRGIDSGRTDVIGASPNPLEIS